MIRHRREGSWFGTGEKSTVLTNLEVRAHVLGRGRVHDGDRVNEPSVVVNKEELAAELAAEAAEEEKEVNKELAATEEVDGIAVNVREENGWRISYCQETPTCAQYLEKVRKLKANVPEEIQKLLTPAKSSKPFEERLAARKRDAAKRKANAAKVASF